MRINQFIAHSLNITRRQADDLITKKLVQIDQQPVGLGYVVVGDEVIHVQTSEGVVELNAAMPARIAVYKPPFCFAVKPSLADPDKKNIFDLIPKMYASYRILGHLDYMTEGVLVLMSPESPSAEPNMQSTNAHSNSDSISSTENIQELGTSEEYIIVCDNQLRLDNVIAKISSVVEVQWGDKAEFEFLHLADNQIICHLTKKRTRASLLRQLKESGLNIQRCIRLRDGRVRLTKELLDSKIVVID
jgi:16S rRNA U516 pseudouridylate synthase RsuA-like enzyme